VSDKTGFRKIDNQTFNALIAAGLSGAGYQVVLTIIDRTLGFRKGSEQKEKAKIPLTYFTQVTGLSRQSVRLAIKQAKARRIITAERNSTRPTIYALNLDTEAWVTRQQNRPSKLGNQTTPYRVTKSPQARKPAIASSMPLKETLKETLKERTTPPHELIREVHNPTPTKQMSLSLYAPKGKAGANSLTNGNTVLPGEDRATLESDLSALGSPSRGYNRLTNRERIIQYLKEHGSASMKEISESTGIKYTVVNLTLSSGKGKYFINPQRGQWELKR